MYLSRKGRRTFKPDANFFNFLWEFPECFELGTCPLSDRGMETGSHRKSASNQEAAARF
jgi:hypothetical protein